jgi:hypothetical protein
MDYRLKELRGVKRRNFLRWIGAVGAAVGIERTGLLNFLADSGGSALADGLCPPTNRSLHIICGNGSFAWFQLLWPHIEVANSMNPAMAYHAFGQGFEYIGPNPGDKLMHYGPQAPWVANGVPTRPVTAYMAGKDETHTDTPGSAATLGSNASMLAAVASIQTQIATLVPVIGVVPFDFGKADGAPAIATVSSGDSMVDLFSSVASNLTLKLQEDKELFETYYKAMLGVRYAAGSPSWKPHTDITKKAARLIGFDYSQALKPTMQDLANYGVNTLNASGATNSQKTKLTAFARAMIVAARAFKTEGLTSSVILGLSPGPTSDTTFTDPHAVFNDMTALNATVQALGDILNGFFNDLAAADDPICTGQKLDKTVVLTAHGDTPHNPLVASGWPDATPGGANWLYVMGNGYLRSGWFGGVRANGQVDGFDALTGADVPDQKSTLTSAAAGSAVAYAVAKGSTNTVAQFNGGLPITGLTATP